MEQKMKNDRKKLPIFRTFLSLFALIAIITLAVYALNRLNDIRNNRIYEKYATETEKYIEMNKNGLEELFEKDWCPNQLSKDASCKPLTPSEVSMLVPHDLKDWSSTMFVKRFSHGASFVYLRLSGQSGDKDFGNPDKEQLILKLFNGEARDIPWDDYIYQLQGKEVVIPVRDNKGVVIGAVIRGVIEQ